MYPQNENQGQGFSSFYFMAVVSRPFLVCDPSLTSLTSGDPGDFFLPQVVSIDTFMLFYLNLTSFHFQNWKSFNIVRGVFWIIIIKKYFYQYIFFIN